jgi:alpha-glucosidase
MTCDWIGLEKIPLFVRGGTIIAGQMAGITTAASRMNPFKLVSQLATNGTAYGYVYLDDGESVNSITDGFYSIIDFSISTSNGVGLFKSNVVHNGFNGTTVTFVSTLTVYGIDFHVASVAVNGVVIDDYSWNYRSNGVCFSFFLYLILLILILSFV